LYKGITLAILSDCGTWPELKDKLNIYNNGSIMSADISFINLGAILSGPGDLLFLKLRIIFSISALVAGGQNILLLSGR